MDEAAVQAHLRRWLAVHRERLGAPGVAVGLTDRERPLGVLTDGLANVEARTPVAAEHLFQIGSIGKSFTAIALLQEREAGRLDVHAPVAEYLPWFEIRSPHPPITVHHLLTHTGGIVTGWDFTGEGAHEVWALREQEVGFAPGERYHYSNAGYKALGLILERLVGLPYADAIRSRILEPLGMAATEPVHIHDTRRRMAVGYAPFYDDRPWHPSHGFAPATWFESATGDGSVCSTALDMTAYMRMLLNRGRGPGGRILSEESFDLLTQAAVPEPDYPGEFYGYGLVSGTLDGRRWIHHTGSVCGYSAWMCVDVDEGHGVVVLENAVAERAALGEFALATLRAVGQGGELPPIGPAVTAGSVPNGAEYEGTYSSVSGVLAVAPEGGGLVLRRDGVRIPLRPVHEVPDAFVVPHPDFERFELRFEREGGVVTHAVHGSRWWAHDRYAGPTSFEDPAGSEPIVGHYRSHNPHHPNFRVVVRRGTLRLMWGWGEEDWELVPLAGGDFRVGAKDWSPRRIRFDTEIDGKATRAIFDCAPYYRTFTL